MSVNIPALTADPDLQKRLEDAIINLDPIPLEDALAAHQVSIDAAKDALEVRDKAHTSLHTKLEVPPTVRAKQQKMLTAAEEAMLRTYEQYEQTKVQLVQAARDRYREITRDDRAEIDVPCPTWDAYETISVNPENPRSLLREVFPEGCKCAHMPVRHKVKEGKPYCYACGAIHADGLQHDYITESDFIKLVIESQ